MTGAARKRRALALVNQARERWFWPVRFDPWRIGGMQAFYLPSDDTVHVSPQPAFFEQINYRTLFHELGHNFEAEAMPHGAD